MRGVLMTKLPIILITGANGEIGHGLIRYLANQSHTPAIVALDLKPLDADLLPLVEEFLVGDILDTDMLDDLQGRYTINTIYHLAALLSTTSEKYPELAHQVNVQGTANLLHMANKEDHTVKFIYPSSIAVYGLPDLATKSAYLQVDEDSFLTPTTMYGVNKLYCEHLGRYYTDNYQQLDTTTIHDTIDFRCVRFPGIISAFTIPSGGTSDYAPEMIHAAIQGFDYECFVREDTTIPFMMMPDAIQALIQLAEAPRTRLTRRTYNVTSFSLSAQEFANILRETFPNMNVTFQPHLGRQAIVDTWPHGLDDIRAQMDWDWQPQYNAYRAFSDYLLPNIMAHYQMLELETA
jgi:threonine 3-dehydrogenase